MSLYVYVYRTFPDIAAEGMALGGQGGGGGAGQGGGEGRAAGGPGSIPPWLVPRAPSSYKVKRYWPRHPPHGAPPRRCSEVAEELVERLQRQLVLLRVATVLIVFVEVLGVQRV